MLSTQIMAWLAGLPLVDAVLGMGIAALFLTLAVSIRSWARLRHIPGPPRVGFSKLWLLRESLHGRLHSATTDVCRKYGPLVRVGPNHLVTDDLEVLRKIWGVRSSYKRGKFYISIRFDPDRDSLVSMRDDHAHAVLRAKMAAGYGGKENENVESSIDTEILSFVDLVETKYLSTETEFRPVDLARKLQYLTLDVITSLAFGKRMGFVTNDADMHSYIRMTERSIPAMITLTLYPTLARILQSRLFRRLMPSEGDLVGFGAFIGVAKRIVGERLASENPYRKDMLGSFLSHGLTREEAEGETLLQILAGSDTTATAIRATLLYLMASPHSYRCLATEVRQRAAEGSLSSPVTSAEAQKMPYLQAVIREGLRIHPPVVGLMNVEVPAGGDVLCGYPVPAGTEIGSCLFGLQRQASIYGADADVFRPERWIEAGEEQLQVMTTALSLNFKAGKWQCLGKDIALLELNKVFVELLRRFDFTLVNPSRPWTSMSAGIFFQSDLFTKITRAEPWKAM